MTTIQTAIKDLRQAIKKHEREKMMPVSCTNAVRTYSLVNEAHRRLARIASGGHTHMTPAEEQYLQMMPTELIDHLEQ